MRQTRLEQLAHSMVQDCIDPIISKTITGAIVSWNRAAEKMFGYAAEEVLGRSIMILVPPERNSEELMILEKLGRGEVIRDLHTFRRHKNGQSIPVTLTISPLFDLSGNVIGACKMVRPRIAESMPNEELLKLAFMDSLTGLSNRAHLLDRLTHAMCRDERTYQHGGVLLIDLDNFKTVNDTAGHLAGDKLLIQCAKRIRSIFREIDTVARWGGDEFVVLIEDLPKDAMTALGRLEDVSRKLLMALRRPYSVNAVEYNCSPSIGACLFRGVSLPVEDVIHQADRAMYKAKSSGKNSFYIDGDRPSDTLDAIPDAAAIA
ncbi:MAG: diguanylate cyclase [Steroidobacteraceae bacterium]